MMKSKPKQPSKKSYPQNDPDTEECVQDGWVVVKKQKVTILIPSLPITEQCTIPSIATKEVDHIRPPQADPPVTLPLATSKPITTLSNPPKLNQMPKPRNPHNCEPNYRRTLGICSAPKAKKCCGSLFNGHIFANPKMRALNLERKLKRAGGLDRWLVSIGLGQFVKIFRCKRVGKVQLVNLTMKKLKDMGADAVGPRRKLMHAIDCLW
ncbi:putative sterile alpha motif domain-containing protein [Helianthus annuus]|uniref:Sterile alpha motif domain-containing protein n=2 Tax=Helianthus annuus TaxID=4232 RepID=A0A9K3EBS1_HELAN|nr:uncharacterized protein LOC110904339 [Helianthus annuus]KAF5770285.1 putative sterile alpha motif domain-containing protein [Helianthus annuus]KAJ0465216.1 putative sterile alpha motif domain-containing protein [Helianthus annuus]KAJ0469971.1 putative sterile alpha motif domain-containing protein [Helianthus annuus]KAJ0486808.1 putative sterile alpha motif domain-containing protein [Helianthus annuus]KAJ0660943.1 putative sterile alpha motif domain-containing protein [Helianthus annuus]